MSCVSNDSKTASDHDTQRLDEIKRWLMSVSPEDGSVELEKDESIGIAILKLCNEKKRNALTGKMMCQLNDYLNEMKNWSNNNGDDASGIKVVIVYGSGGFFCSGLDLNLGRIMLDDQQKATEMAYLMKQNMNMLSSLPSMVSVAVIEGKALGGGAEVAACCNFVVMSSTAEIGFVHVRMGITYAFGGGVRLVRNVRSPDQAMRMLLTGDRYGAVHCHKVGLCSCILMEQSTERRFEEAINYVVSAFCKT